MRVVLWCFFSACAAVPTPRPVVQPVPRPDSAAVAAFAAHAFAAPEAPSPAHTLELAEALEQAHLPLTAAHLFSTLVADPTPIDASRTRAVEGLLRIQRVLDDTLLIPSTVSREMDDVGPRLEPDAAARFHFLRARIAHLHRNREDALRELDAIPAGASIEAKASYLRAMVLADPGLYPRPQPEAALVLLQKIRAMNASGQEDFDRVKGLAALALGRICYGLLRYDAAVTWFGVAADEVEEDLRAAALFEGAQARFAATHRIGDRAAALAMLHSPEVRSSLNGEAAVLEIAIQYFTGVDIRSPEALAPLNAIERQLPDDVPGYGADPEQVIVWADGLSPPVRHWVADRPAQLRISLCNQAATELRAIRSASWSKSGLGAELIDDLERQRRLLTGMAASALHARVTALLWSVRLWKDQALIFQLEQATERGDAPRASDLLRRIIPHVEDGSPQKAELLFRLAETYRAIAAASSKEPRMEGLYLRETAAKLDDVLRDYPQYARRDEVLFALAIAFEQLRKVDRASALYRQLLRDFPSSEQAGEARARLKTLSTP